MFKVMIVPLGTYCTFLDGPVVKEFVHPLHSVGTPVVEYYITSMAWPL